LVHRSSWVELDHGWPDAAVGACAFIPVLLHLIIEQRDVVAVVGMEPPAASTAAEPPPPLHPSRPPCPPLPNFLPPLWQPCPGSAGVTCASGEKQMNHVGWSASVDACASTSPSTGIGAVEWGAATSPTPWRRHLPLPCAGHHLAPADKHAGGRDLRRILRLPSAMLEEN
jgi:hypothetical protein